MQMHAIRGEVSFFFFFFSFSYFPSFLSLGFFLQSRRNFEGGKVDCKTELSLV